MTLLLTQYNFRKKSKKKLHVTFPATNIVPTQCCLESTKVYFNKKIFNVFVYELIANFHCFISEQNATIWAFRLIFLHWLYNNLVTILVFIQHHASCNMNFLLIQSFKNLFFFESCQILIMSNALLIIPLCTIWSGLFFIFIKNRCKKFWQSAFPQRELIVLCEQRRSTSVLKDISQ